MHHFTRKELANFHLELPGAHTQCCTGCCIGAGRLGDLLCCRSPGVTGTLAITSGYLLKLDPFGGAHWDAADAATGLAYAAPVLLAGAPASLWPCAHPGCSLNSLVVSDVDQRPVELGAHVRGYNQAAWIPASDAKRPQAQPERACVAVVGEALLPVTHGPWPAGTQLVLLGKRGESNEGR